MCLGSFILNPALQTDAERLLKSFLARNELVAASSACFCGLAAERRYKIVPGCRSQSLRRGMTVGANNHRRLLHLMETI